MSPDDPTPAEKYRDDRRRRLNAAGSEIADVVTSVWDKYGLTAAEIHAAVERAAHEMAQEVLKADWERQARAEARKQARSR